MNAGSFDLGRVFGWTAGGAATVKPVNLALQGGGAHGAFTWGVLDALLADGRLKVHGISGASAGAMNAVVLADGLTRGGPEQARTQLAEFWRGTSRAGRLPELQRQVIERLFSGGPRNASPTRAWLDAMARLMSPYDANPLNINVLKDVLERVVDFAAVRSNDALALFVSATDVQTGRLRVFQRHEITPEVVLASACLPWLFRAVEIDGRSYWDGGFVGNPVLFPFVRATPTEDVVLVQINPLLREDVPTTASDIMSRVHELTFNAPLLAELRGVAFVSRLIDAGRLPRGTRGGRYRRLRVHRIALAARDNQLDAASKLSTHAEHFELLCGLGREAAHEFLVAHFHDIGVRGTVDLDGEALVA